MRAISLAIPAVAVLVATAWAATPEQIEKHELAVAARTQAKIEAKAERDLGGALPLPINQDLKKSNSPQDLLHVQLTYSKNENGTNVAFARIVWGDLNNLIKGTGKQYYSNWDGYLELTNATGTVVHKIQFDDGKTKCIPHNPSAATHPAKEPGPGSGRDELLTASGPKIQWKAGVVGALDGLRIKLSSPTPSFSGTLKAGNFTIPFTITPEPVEFATPAHK